MCMVYILNCENTEVTNFYLNIVQDMFVKAREDVRYCNRVKKCKNKQDIFVVSTVIDFVKAYVSGYKNIFLWVQGIASEESYLNHHSKVRKLVLDALTKFSLVKAKGIWYVSDEMRKFEDRKFKISTAEKSYIMPCFNTEIDSDSFFIPNKYSNNIFAYVGSLSKWQCFEETLDFYKIIEASVSNAELRVYTFSKEKAHAILTQKGIKNFMVDCVSPNKMTQVLSEVKFGFVLRENISVNNVATPTKFSSYMAAGVIPIFSNCIYDFAGITRTLKYKVDVSSNKTVPSKIYDLCTEDIEANDVLNEYSTIFARYYNREHYIVDSQIWIKDRLNTINNMK